MKTIKELLLSAAFSFFIIGSVKAENLTEKLVVHYINYNIKKELYSGKDIKWEHGYYSTKVNRAGDAILKSNSNSIVLELPVDIELNGKIKKNVFGFKLTVGCNAQLTTSPLATLTPSFSADKVIFLVDIEVDIPPTEMDCDGVKLPIQAALQNLVETEKSNWEKDVKLKLEEQFNE